MHGHAGHAIPRRHVAVSVLPSPVPFHDLALQHEQPADQLTSNAASQTRLMPRPQCQSFGGARLQPFTVSASARCVFASVYRCNRLQFATRAKPRNTEQAFPTRSAREHMLQAHSRARILSACSAVIPLVRDRNPPTTPPEITGQH